MFTENQMCYKSANVASVANVVQICTGRILFLLQSTKLSQPDKIIGIRAINIVFIIDIVEPNGFKGLCTYYVSRRRGGRGGHGKCLSLLTNGGGLAIFILLFRNLGVRIGCFD